MSQLKTFWIIHATTCMNPTYITTGHPKSNQTVIVFLLLLKWVLICFFVVSCCFSPPFFSHQIKGYWKQCLRIYLAVNPHLEKKNERKRGREREGGVCGRRAPRLFSLAPESILGWDQHKTVTQMDDTLLFFSFCEDTCLFFGNLSGVGCRLSLPSCLDYSPVAEQPALCWEAHVFRSRCGEEKGGGGVSKGTSKNYFWGEWFHDLFSLCKEPC